MAVGVLTAAPEFTKQIYDDVTEKMFGHASPMREDEAPEGLIVHSAGQGEQGTTSTTSGSRARPSSASWRRSSARRSERSWAAHRPKAGHGSTSRFLQSPLTDSNRRPPPYHLTPAATSCNARQQIWLVSAVSRPARFAGACHWLRLLGSINAPSPSAGLSDEKADPGAALSPAREDDPLL
jgi:hypothetical protein